MPEGDTVWLTARRLDVALAGHTVVRGELRVPQHSTVQMAGRRVNEVVSRGKHLLLRFDDHTTLHTHLRMDGAWHLYGARDRWRGGPDWQVRALLVTSTRAAVGYRLPVVQLMATADEAEVVGHLGPDLLGKDWDETSALRRLMLDPQRPIGEALLDQRVMAGLGNLYRTELCFIVGVTPWTPVADVATLSRVPGLAHRLLMVNRDGPSQVTTGRSRRGQEHWVYGRRACLRCTTPVRRSMQGAATQQRVTYWCPSCQQGPVG